MILESIFHTSLVQSKFVDVEDQTGFWALYLFLLSSWAIFFPSFLHENLIGIILRFYDSPKYIWFIIIYFSANDNSWGVYNYRL